jgi:NTP pyrophosphatase (non-canonical NTP hydrolase)|tara:strand:- start:37 stop:384 length:348 start_codon:yes stop_codon:yes gene_type:complete
MTDDKEKYKAFLRDYQVWTRDTAIYKQKVTYPSLLLASEVGEALNIIQKVMRDDDSVVSDEKREALSYELGDILWALARLVDDLGLDFSKIAERNIAKLEDRKKRNVISGSGDKR